MRILRGRVEREMLFRLVIFRDRRARLHRVRNQAVIGDVERHDIGRRLEGGVGCAFVTDGPVVDHVARGFRVQLRRARLDRSADVRNGGQLFVIDDDGFRRVLGLVLGLGDHDRDRLTHKAHGLRRHRRPCAHLHARAIPGGNGPAADQIADLVVDELLTGQHADHARHLHRRRRIDTFYLGMCMRAADEVCVGHAQQLDIVDVAAFAGNETTVFLAHDACANAFNAHVLSSQPELLFPLFRFETRC